MPLTTDFPAALAAHPLISQWIDFTRPGVATLRTGRVELGQGNVTALLQIAADELDLRMDQLIAISGDTRATPDEGVTSGSLSIESGGRAVRLAASAARAVFVESAARSLGVAPSQVCVRAGAFVRDDAATGHTYWSLAPGVDLAREVAAHAAPKAAAARRIAGTSVPRVDLERKIRGGGFIQDLRLEGMVHGRVLHPPSRNARLAGANLDFLGKKHALLGVVRNGSFVAVIAPRERDAIAAIGEAERHCGWTQVRGAPGDPVAAMEASGGAGEVSFTKGEAPADGVRVETLVTRPYLAHASIGTSCAIAVLNNERLTVWSHSQGVFSLREALAKTLGMPADRIDVVHREGSGCYGHNGADDVALEAALLARAVPGRPVRVVWSRADEFASSPLGPAAVVRAAAIATPEGRLASMTLDIVGQPYGNRPNRNERANLLAAEYLEGAQPQSLAGDIAQGMERNAVPIYAVAHVRVTKRIADLPLRTSSLRSLGAFVNVFAIETLMDDLAERLGCDAIGLRLAHLEDARARAVLERLAALCRWPGARGEGRGMGIGVARYKNSAAYCGVAAEVAADTHRIRVTRMWAVVDAGEVINPDGVANQIEGGMVQAASWTLKERVQFDGEVIASRDWAAYPILAFSETPQVEVEIIERPDEKALGVAEAAQGPAAAAIGNAVFYALGARVRRLPITTEAVIAA